MTGAVIHRRKRMVVPVVLRLKHTMLTVVCVMLTVVFVVTSLVAFLLFLEVVGTAADASRCILLRALFSTR
jgi:hypothetical protein